MATKRIGPFEKWYRECYKTWWKDEKAGLQAAWEKLESWGVPADEIADVFTEVAEAIKAQYGE